MVGGIENCLAGVVDVCEGQQVGAPADDEASAAGAWDREMKPSDKGCGFGSVQKAGADNNRFEARVLAEGTHTSIGFRLGPCLCASFLDSRVEGRILVDFGAGCFGAVNPGRTDMNEATDSGRFGRFQ